MGGILERDDCGSLSLSGNFMINFMINFAKYVLESCKEKGGEMI